MATTQLNLKAVPNVPNLMVADFKTDDGDEMRAIVVDKNTIKLVSADGSLDGFGGITVTGPDVTTIALNWPSIAGMGKKVAALIKETFGSGSQGCTPKSSVDIDFGSDGKVKHLHAESECKPN